MKRFLVVIFVLAMVLGTTVAQASDDTEKYKKIKIFDSIQVFVDANDMVKADEVKAYAQEYFQAFMGDMRLNDGAWVDNYPAAGYEIENVGYIIIKVMNIRTVGGVNAYHLNFEFGVPPRQLYWETAMMGIAPNTFDFKKELKEDVEAIIEKFADAFREKRGWQ
nr:hypothetical protein [uncultured Pseudodesulfovibrio sp.]